MLLVFWHWMGLLLLLLLLQMIELRIHSIHRILLHLNNVLLILELLLILISLFLELLQLELISLLFRHVEWLAHASRCFATFGFGQSCKEIVLIVYKKLSFDRCNLLWRQIVLSKVSVITISHSCYHIKHECLITSTLLQMHHESVNRSFERVVEIIEIRFNQLNKLKSDIFGWGWIWTRC